MAWQNLPYIILFTITATVFTIVALRVWQRGRVPGARAVAVLMLTSAEWMMGNALELGSTDLLAKLFWVKLQYVGIIILPVAWLAFILEYTGREKWLTRRALALMSIVPLGTLLLVFTNEAHSLIWSRVVLDSTGPFPFVDLTHNIGFWIFLGYSGTLVLISILLAGEILIRSRHLYRWQASVFLLGAFIIGLLTVLDVSGSSPFPQLGLTPVAVALIGLIAVYGLLRARYGEIVPVAREAIIENMRDSVIVLGAQNRIVDLNPAAQHLIGRLASQAIGQSVEQVWSACPDLIKHPQDSAEVDEEVLLGKGEQERAYDVRISPLVDWRGRLVSRIVVLRDITERRRIEEALRESEERYRILAEAAHDMIYVINRDDQIEYVNDSAAGQFGGRPEELVGKQLEALFPPTVVEEQRKNLRQVIETHQPVYGEKKIVFPRGEAWVSTWLVPMKDEAGQVRTVLGVSRDISDRKRAEEALRESEKRFRALIENSSDAIALISAEGTILYESPSVSRFWGYSLKERIGRSAFEWIHPDDVQQVTDLFTQIIQTPGASATAQVRFRSKDGEWQWIEAVGTNLLAEPSVQAVVANFRDITEHKQAEIALELSEARYRSIVEDQSELINRYLPDGTLTFVNDAHCRYFHTDRGSIIGRNFFQFLPDETRKEVETLIAALRPENHVKTTENRYVLPSGEIRWLQWTNRAIFDEQGRLIELQSVGRDITERKSAERRLSAQHGVTHALAESATLQEAALKILQATCASLNWDLGEFWIVDQPANVLRCVQTWRAPSVEVSGFEAATRQIAFVPGVGLLGRVWSSGKPAWIADVVQDPNFPRAPSAAKEGLHGTCAFPILLEGQVLGVLDFLSREIRQPDHDLLEMFATIGSQIGQFIERRRAEEELRHLSTHDVLTGLYNRAFFEEEMARLQRGREFPVSIVMVDVDDLKVINDTQGHTAGDELLRQVTAVLLTAFRAEDVVARIGGDEFAALLPGADAKICAAALKRIRSGVAGHTAANAAFPISLSLGAATAENAERLSEALKQADAQMYKDKRGEEC